MSFAGPLTQEDLRAPKILVAAEKGKKKAEKKKLWYSEAKALPLLPANPQQKSGELTLLSKLEEAKRKQSYKSCTSPTTVLGNKSS